MRKILNITSENIQRHRILFEEDEVVLTLRFNPTVQNWTIDVSYKTFQIFGIKLSLSVLHFRSSNQPFDFFLIDNSGLNLDAFRVDDFSSDRYSLYILDPSDMEEIRGTAVAI